MRVMDHKLWQVIFHEWAKELSSIPPISAPQFLIAIWTTKNYIDYLKFMVSWNRYTLLILWGNVHFVRVNPTFCKGSYDGGLTCVTAILGDNNINQNVTYEQNLMWSERSFLLIWHGLTKLTNAENTTNMQSTQSQQFYAHQQTSGKPSTAAWRYFQMKLKITM